MTLREIVERLDLKVYSGEDRLEQEVMGGYVSDLLSDVMGFADAGEVWVTLQTHRNVIGIASLKDLAAIVLVKNFEPEEDALATAKQEGVVVLGTEMETFEVAGKLYALLTRELK